MRPIGPYAAWWYHQSLAPLAIMGGFAATVATAAVVCRAKTDFTFTPFDYGAFTAGGMAIAAACFCFMAWILRSFPQELALIRYWKKDLKYTECFPANAEERRQFRERAETALEEAESEREAAEYGEMLLETELKILKDGNDLFEIAGKEDELEIARIEIRKAEEKYAKRWTFFFLKWPQGSGILKDDGGTLRRRVPQAAPAPGDMLPRGTPDPEKVCV